MIFFANILPGIAFALDLIETTGQTGVQEVLLATVSISLDKFVEVPSLSQSKTFLGMQFVAAAAAAFLGAQPLLISGVTGPITVFNKTIYDIFVKNGSGGPDFVYLHFIGWVYLWGAILHWVSALLNGKSFSGRWICETRTLRLFCCGQHSGITSQIRDKIPM